MGGIWGGGVVGWWSGICGRGLFGGGGGFRMVVFGKCSLVGLILCQALVREI